MHKPLWIGSEITHIYIYIYIYLFIDIYIYIYYRFDHRLLCRGLHHSLECLVLPGAVAGMASRRGCCWGHSHLEVSIVIRGYPNGWMVYDETSYENGWFRGTPMTMETAILLIQCWWGLCSFHFISFHHNKSKNMVSASAFAECSSSDRKRMGIVFAWGGSVARCEVGPAGRVVFATPNHGFLVIFIVDLAVVTWCCRILQ